MPQKPTQWPCLRNPSSDMPQKPINWQWHFPQNLICEHVLETHPVAMPLKLTQWPCYASEIHSVTMPQNPSSGHASEIQPVTMPQKSI